MPRITTIAKNSISKTIQKAQLPMRLHFVSTDRSMFAFTDRRPSLKFSAKFIELGGIY